MGEGQPSPGLIQRPIVFAKSDGRPGTGLYPSSPGSNTWSDGR
jgi:hypothetical protein